jgi:hypothetical protein
MVLCRARANGQAAFRKQSRAKQNMEFKGVEYSVVQLVDDAGWRWEVRLGDGNNKTGVTTASRAVAIRLAKYELERALKSKE